MTVREYVGARYVPLIAQPAEWSKETAYEPLTIVLYQGNSYTSRQAVPIGIEITNEEYWVVTGNYNAQIEQYRKEAKAATETAENAKTTAMQAVGDAADAAADASEAKDIATSNTAAINQIKADKSKKWIAYIFQDTALRQSIEFFTDFITRCKKAGFAALQMVIHVNPDGSVIEDESKFSQYNAIATQNGIDIISVKMHGVYTSPNYFAHIQTALNAFPKVTTVFILNEDLVHAAQGVTLINQIKQFKPDIKVGITGGYTDCFLGKRDYSGIDNYDILGLNMYPHCAQFNNPIIDETVINEAFNRRMIIPWDKELWITECGVLPYLQFLNNPEQYSLSKLSDTSKTIEGQKAFYKELSKCNMATRATHIIPWYMESFMDASLNYEMFDEFKNIIESW